MWNAIAKFLVKAAIWAAKHPEVIEEVIQIAKDKNGPSEPTNATK